MSNGKEIANGLSSIFNHRESHLIIGLTGRTGSGCTSMAEILSKNKFQDIDLPQINNPPKVHEDRKTKIINEWLNEKWSKFSVINVSGVIFLHVLSLPGEDVENYIKEKIQETEQLHEKNLPEFREVINQNSNVVKEVLSILANLRQREDSEVHKAHKFIFEILPEIADNARKNLEEHGRILYTRIFQKFGDNIRTSGSAISEEIKPDSLLTLPATIGQILKLKSMKDRLDGISKTYVVIDAIRHPFEARYLRERFARFYLVAVNTDDDDRKARLHNLNYTNAEIENLDEREYPSESKNKKTGYTAMVSRDIQGCLALADVYISNLGRSQPKDVRVAAQQIVRYIALMQHPGLITPSSIERCMQSAFAAKVNSGCISRQVGAVVTDNSYGIKAIGWNDVPRGQTPCLLRNMNDTIRRHDESAYSDYELQNNDFRGQLTEKIRKIDEKTTKGRNKCYCFKDIYNSLNGEKNQVHTRSLHAEENAFLQISRTGGQGVEGGNLFSTASPCELCAKKAFQLGIKRIYYIDPYPGISQRHVLASGENRPEVILYSGAIGRAYHDLYEPILSFKDELEKLSAGN